MPNKEVIFLFSTLGHKQSRRWGFWIYQNFPNPHMKRSIAYILHKNIDDNIFFFVFFILNSCSYCLILQCRPYRNKANAGAVVKDYLFYKQILPKYYAVINFIPGLHYLWTWTFPDIKKKKKKEKKKGTYCLDIQTYKIKSLDKATLFPVNGNLGMGTRDTMIGALILQEQSLWGYAFIILTSSFSTDLTQSLQSYYS